jgi:DNA-binding response OmpR family regulator
LTGLTILLVEDEPLISLDIQTALTGAGAEVLTAVDAADGARLVAKSKLSAAVLDVDLGDLDCWVVCRLLARAGVPFLFYTGYTQSDVFKDWPQAPVHAKPMTHEELVAAVVNLLQAERMPDDASASAAPSPAGT